MRATHRIAVTALMALPILASAGFAFACQDGEDERENNTTGDNVNASPPSYTVTAGEFSYAFPERIAAGTLRLRLENTGVEPHQASLFRINDGVTDAQFQATLTNPDPAPLFQLTTPLGGPNTVDPGSGEDVVTTVESGRYAWLCFFPSPDGVPHIARGMARQFEVTPSDQAQQPEPPAADSTLTMADFNFAGMAALAEGSQTVAVTNDGPQVHELTVMRLPDGLDITQLMRTLGGEAGTPLTPPRDGHSGGIAGMAPGQTAWVDLDLRSGRYALLCFVPDPATGKPHYALGMITEVTV